MAAYKSKVPITPNAARCASSRACAPYAPRSGRNTGLVFFNVW
jgi:hypothetical protein